MRTRFITSAASAAGFPLTELPEIAFVGRSNVGKSSLLNALAAAKIARTSRTPGRTQLVNFFDVHTKEVDYVLADLPGYGFARAPEAVRVTFGKLIDAYLKKREQLSAVLILFDMRRSVEEDDVALYRRIEAAIAKRGARIIPVGTKADKLAKGEIKPALASIGRALGIPKDSGEILIATSTTKQLGIGALRDRIQALAVDRALPSVE
jgi:GTP-binding protein